MKTENIALKAYQAMNPFSSITTASHVGENATNPNTISTNSPQKTTSTELANKSLIDFDNQISKIENLSQKYTDTTHTAEEEKDVLFHEAMSIVEKVRAQYVENPLRGEDRQEITTVLNNTVNQIRTQQNLGGILSRRSPEAINILLP